jgi:hypothetical protein
MIITDEDDIIPRWVRYLPRKIYPKLIRQRDRIYCTNPTAELFAEKACGKRGRALLDPNEAEFKESLEKKENIDGVSLLFGNENRCLDYCDYVKIKRRKNQKSTLAEVTTLLEFL